MSKANEISELKDLTAEPRSLERSAEHVTKYRLDEINNIKNISTLKLKREK